MITEEEFMDIGALHRQGLSYAEIGRLLGRDWRTVKRYLEQGAQPVYRRRRLPSKLDPFKPIVDQWLVREPRLQARRIHQDLVRDYGFEGSYHVVRRYLERARPEREPAPVERFETAPGQQAQVDWSHEPPLVTPSGLELPLYCFHMLLGHSREPSSASAARRTWSASGPAIGPPLPTSAASPARSSTTARRRSCAPTGAGSSPPRRAS